MKKIFILLLLPIFLFGAVGCGNKTTKKEEKKEEQKVKLDLTKYEDYTFEDLKIYEEDLKGQKIHEPREWIEYVEKTEVLFDTFSEGVTYNLEINDGHLKITNNSTGENYTFNKIINAKNIMICVNGQVADERIFIILTTDGDLYYRDASSKSPINLVTFEDEFNLLNSEYKFEKIGYETYFAFASKSLGALTTTDEQVTIDLWFDEPTVSNPYLKDTSARFVIATNNHNYQFAYIKTDGSVVLYNPNSSQTTDYIVDENGEKIYATYVFSSHIIDFEGYIYKVNPETFVAEKVSSSKVAKIGAKELYEGVNKYVVVLEDNEFIEVRYSELEI